MFRVNDKVKVTGTNKKGIVVSYDEIEKGVYEVEVKIKDKVEKFLSFDLRRDGPVKLSVDDLRNIFRYSMDYFDLVFAGQDYEEYEMKRMLAKFEFEKEYTPTLDDLIAFLMNLKVKNASVDDFNRWRYVVNMVLKYCYLSEFERSDADFDRWLFKNNGDIIEFVFGCLLSPEVDDDEYGEELMDDLFDLEGLIKEVQIVKENYEKDLPDREYSDQTMRNVLLYVTENKMISQLEYPYDEIFKRFVITLAEKDDNVGLDVLGYSVYGGNELFECDWVKAQQIFEKLYSRTGDPNYANTLGYIYYFGRANKGIAQDDLAFKYFSVGAAAGNYESLYKLADMFIAGRGVVKNRNIGENIYYDLFNENKEVMEAGFFDCKFADIAYRVGSTYLDGEDSDYIPAYYYFLMAKYAIDKRIQQHDFYGDSNVKKNIEEAIEKCKEVLQIPLRKSVFIPEPFIVRDLLANDYHVDVKLKHLKNNRVKMTFKRVVKGGRTETEKILLPFFDFHGCTLTDEFTFYAEKVKEVSDNNEFRITHYEIYDDGNIEFIYFDKCVGYIVCDGFRLNNFVKN
ncbi:MAG TPA: hypothetical protein PLI19_05695 [Erysipelotrichaceae bacterium]|nr:hypothetical protein [Erysipelotrichaceae bacterium]